MAQVFNRALQQDPNDAAYRLLLQELQQPQQSVPAGFSPEEQRRRIAENNAMLQMGILGQLAGDEQIQGVGGQVFKNALGARQERVSNRGVQDPLTGETTIDPEYAAEQQRSRRGQILQQALQYERDRQSAAERAADRAADREARAADARDRNATMRAIADIRANATTQAAATRTGALPKPPAGYRYTAEGDMEMIPGGPADVKAKAGEQKKLVLQDAAMKVADRMIAETDAALKKVSRFNTGMGGAIAEGVPGGRFLVGKTDLEANINTIKANIGFGELQAMREASPTGGALGQVAVQELNMLQATLGSLDTTQSAPILTEQLEKVNRHFRNWKEAVERARRGEESMGPGYVPPTGGSWGTPAAAPVAPAAAPVAPAAVQEAAPGLPPGWAVTTRP